MFQLAQQIATLSNFNPRTELEGKDARPAADLKILIKASNALLGEFSPSLLDSFYYKGNGREQGELIDPVSQVPNLKHPIIKGAVDLNLDLTGYTAEIENGIGASPIVIGDAKVNAFSLDMQEGGTVFVLFRIQAHPGERESGRLCTMIQQEIKLTLTPPASQAELAE